MDYALTISASKIRACLGGRFYGILGSIDKQMITANVNEMGILLTLDSTLDNLSREGWDSLLDELRSQYIPSFYQDGKRMHVDISPEGKPRAVIYFTSQTVTIDDAIGILKKRNIHVRDVRESPAK